MQDKQPDQLLMTFFAAVLASDPSLVEKGKAREAHVKGCLEVAQMARQVYADNAGLTVKEREEKDKEAAERERKILEVEARIKQTRAQAEALQTEARRIETSAKDQLFELHRQRESFEAERAAVVEEINSMKASLEEIGSQIRDRDELIATLREQLGIKSAMAKVDASSESSQA